MDKIKECFSEIKTKIDKKIKSIKQFISQNTEELLMFSGLFFILCATYLINYIAFLYVLGFILIGFSLFLLKFKKKGGE